MPVPTTDPRSAANKAQPASGAGSGGSVHLHSKPAGPTLPRTPEYAASQIGWECGNVQWRSDRHSRHANFWETVTSWTTVIVTLTAGISALSVFANSTVMASVFAAITALIAAINAGFNPSDRAKKHRDAARAYGHLERPLAELFYKLESYRQTEYHSQTAYDQETQSYHDAGFYQTVDFTVPSEDLGDIWLAFLKDRERIESIDETAPTLNSRDQAALMKEQRVDAALARDPSPASGPTSVAGQG